MQTTIPRNCRTSFVLQQLRSDGPSTIMIFTGKSPLPSTPHADRLLSSAFVWLTFTTPNLSKDAQYTWLCSSLSLSKLMSGFPLSFCLNCAYSLFRGAGLSLWLQTLLVKNDVKHFLYFCFKTLHLTISLQVSQISGLQYVIFNFFYFFIFLYIYFLPETRQIIEKSMCSAQQQRYWCLSLSCYPPSVDAVTKVEVSVLVFFLQSRSFIQLSCGVLICSALLNRWSNWTCRTKGSFWNSLTWLLWVLSSPWTQMDLESSLAPPSQDLFVLFTLRDSLFTQSWTVEYFEMRSQ